MQWSFTINYTCNSFDNHIKYIYVPIFDRKHYHLIIVSFGYKTFTHYITGNIWSSHSLEFNCVISIFRNSYLAMKYSLYFHFFSLRYPFSKKSLHKLDTSLVLQNENELLWFETLDISSYDFLSLGENRSTR